ncbi:MAG: hypothetical protein HDS57_04445 [Barnesiella sp.]|nr:hypothetical protein [Barnesiella sp.]MBD5330387.1 hypothetical protein [Bacteroides sp.]
MKKSVAILSITLIGILSFLFSNVIFAKKDISNSVPSEVESLANLEEWWNRLDYVCVKVECNCILYQFHSVVAQPVEEGKGTVAHTWSCTGCGDCGWIVVE